MRRKFASFAAVSTMLASIATFTAVTPAHAVDRSCNKNSGQFCVYKNKSFDVDGATDYMYKAHAANNDWTAAWDHVVNDDSSWKNWWTVPVRIYDHNFYESGVVMCIPAGTKIASFTRTKKETGPDDGMSHKDNGKKTC